MVAQAGALSTDICSCLQPTGCIAVGNGSFSNVINEEITITGNLSPLPFESLRGATDQDLFCFQGKHESNLIVKTVFVIF